MIIDGHAHASGDFLTPEGIMQTLDACGGNKKKTAEKLKIGLKTLYRKLSQYEEED